MNPHYQERHHSLTLVPCILLTIAMSFVGIVVANSQQGTREIVSDDFTRNRPAKSTDSPKGSQGQSPGGATSRPKPHRTYRLASQPIRKPGPQTRPGKNGQPPLENLVAQLGITLWKLRPARSNDTGVRQLVRENGESSEWIPERIESDTLLRSGDRVRISIESPQDGYLYVVDRDEFTDGSTGAINLIFPLAGEDNHVYAGRLIDIPAADAKPMKANPAPNQNSEVLSIIVTSKPLELPLSDQVLPISLAQLQQWEKMWGGETERFEMEGGVGEAWTKQEQQAALKKGTRQLTRDDPAPQTIYRVSAAIKNAFLVNVRLRYAK